MAAGTVSRNAIGVSVPFVTFVPFGSANQPAAADFTPTASLPVSTAKLAFAPVARPGAPQSRNCCETVWPGDTASIDQFGCRSRKLGVVGGVYASTPCVSASSAAGAEMRPEPSPVTPTHSAFLTGFSLLGSSPVSFTRTDDVSPVIVPSHARVVAVLASAAFSRKYSGDAPAA